MKPLKREEIIKKLSRKNRFYKYERLKKYLDPQRREIEVQALAKDLMV